MTTPSVLILLWCGFAATTAAAFVGSVLAPRTAAAWALLPRSRSASTAAASLIAGFVVYPVIYGIAFEALHRADLRIGLLLGFVHALLAFLLGQPARRPRVALRLAAMHLAYALTVALLYVTP